MTIAQSAPAMTRSSSRWLLLGSLALNLFFVGVALAMAIRAPAPPAWDRNVFVRVEHIADTLPPADADLLRGQINANRQLIDDAQTAISFRAGPYSCRRCGATRSTPTPCAPPWRRRALRGRLSTRSSRGCSRSRRRKCRRPAARPWPTGLRAAKQQSKGQ